MLEESGEALELQLVGNGDGNIIRRNLRGPGQAGLLAVDQTATVDTPIVWTFADSAGTVTTTALVDASGLWRVYQRRFDSHGNVPKGKAGGDSDAALLAVPVVWRGLRQDEVSGLYLTGATVYDPSNGRYLAQLSPDTNPYRFNSNRPNSPDPATVEVARLDEPNSFGTYGAFTAGLADSFLFGNFSYAFGGDAAVQELARTNAYFVGQ